MLKETFDSLYTVQCRVFGKIRIFNIIIFQSIRCIRNLIQSFFPLVIEKENMFSSIEVRVENVRHINIKMKEGYRTFSSKEHIGIFIQKATHKILRRDVVF